MESVVFFLLTFICLSEANGGYMRFGEQLNFRVDTNTGNCFCSFDPQGSGGAISSGFQSIPNTDSIVSSVSSLLRPFTSGPQMNPAFSNGPNIHQAYGGGMRPSYSQSDESDDEGVENYYSGALHRESKEAAEEEEEGERERTYGAMPMGIPHQSQFNGQDSPGQRLFGENRREGEEGYGLFSGPRPPLRHY